MTVICAVKKDGKIALAGSTSACYGPDIILSGDTFSERSPSNIMKFKNLIVGSTGVSANIFPVYRMLSGVDGADLKTSDDVFDLALYMHNELKEKYFVRTDEEDPEPYESSQINLVLATPEYIYVVDSIRTISEMALVATEGSGEYYAHGAIEALYNLPDMTALDIANRAAEIACKFDPKSAGPVKAHVLDGYES